MNAPVRPTPAELMSALISYWNSPMHPDFTLLLPAQLGLTRMHLFQETAQARHCTAFRNTVVGPLREEVVVDEHVGFACRLKPEDRVSRAEAGAFRRALEREVQ